MRTHHVRPPADAYLLVCLGYSSGHACPNLGKFLASADANAHGGRGTAEWTNDPTKALHFTSPGAAWACWQEQSRVAPRRADGQPNRPLTAYTTTVRALPDVAAQQPEKKKEQ